MKIKAKNIVVLGVTVLLIYILYFTWGITNAYMLFKKDAKMDGLLLIATTDSSLGYKPKPNSKAMYKHADGTKIADIFIDKNGFRYDGKAYSNSDSLKFLFLGCSFTFGMNCDFEDTYPAIVSNYYHAKCYNAAMGGYGFSQMILQAEKLIPELKPDVVFFQNTDWLIERSKQPFSGTIPCSLATPYFTREDSFIKINSPLFNNNFFAFSELGIFKKTEIGVYDYLNFVRACSHLIFRDHLFKFNYYSTTFFRKERQITDAQIANYVFLRISAICKSNNAKLVVVGLQEQSYKPENNQDLVYIDAEEYLIRKHRPLLNRKDNKE